MNYKEAYQWLHGDRVEYSGCREAAEAMMKEIRRLEALVNKNKPTIGITDAAFNVASHKAFSEKKV